MLTFTVGELLDPINDLIERYPFLDCGKYYIAGVQISRLIAGFREETTLPAGVSLRCQSPQFGCNFITELVTPFRSGRVSRIGLYVQVA